MLYFVIGVVSLNISGKMFFDSACRGMFLDIWQRIQKREFRTRNGKHSVKILRQLKQPEKKKAVVEKIKKEVNPFSVVHITERNLMVMEKMMNTATQGHTFTKKIGQTYLWKDNMDLKIEKII